MVDPLSSFSFQPVLHNWCNKGCGMCYPVCWGVNQFMLHGINFNLNIEDLIIYIFD